MPGMTTFSGGIGVPGPTISDYPDNDGYTTPPAHTTKHHGYGGAASPTPTPAATVSTAPSTPAATLPVTGPDSAFLGLGFGLVAVGAATFLGAVRTGRRRPEHVPRHAA